LGSEQGLPSLKVYDLMEDSLGVMWAGTSEGLVHYDGLWLNTLKSPTAISQDRSMLQLGDNGMVWSINFAGEVFLADYERMYDFPHLRETVSEKIMTLERVGDKLYFMSKKELVETDLSGKNAVITRKAEDNERFYGFAGNRFLHSSLGLTDLKLNSRTIHPDRNPFNLSAGKESDYRYYYTTGKVERVSQSGTQELVASLQRKGGAIPLITGVRETSAGIWILTYDGAYLIGKDQWLFPGIPISDVVETTDGAHWFSTLTDGIHVIPDLELKRYGREPDGLPTQRFNKVAALPNGNIIATDNNGVALLIHPDKGVLATFKAEFTRESEAVFVDTVHQRLLVAFGDLYLLEMTTLKQLDHLVGNVKSITLKGDSLVIVNASFLTSLKYDGNRFGEAKNTDPPPSFYQNLVDGNGNDWLLSDQGLLVGRKLWKGDGTLRFSPKLMGRSETGHVFLSNRKDSIAEMDGDNVKNWWLIPPELRQGAMVRAMAGNADNLFVLLSNAVLKMETRTGEWQRLGSSDGLPSTDLKDMTISNDRIWIATFNGLYSILMERKTRLSPPKVQLRMLRVNGENVPITENLEFEHDRNDIEVVLRGISTNSRGRIQFAYLLEGMMNNYEISPNNAVIRFRSLAPGEYSLDVFALDVNGTPSTEHQRLQFTVLQPWYLTWPFIIFASVLLIVIVSAIFLFRIRYINQRNSQELERSRLMEDLRASQMTALRAQMNPHFMFNVLNSIQGLFTLGKAEKANEVMSRFSDLMRSILDVSDQNTIGLDKELELIGLYLELEAVRFGDEFHYRLEVAQDIDPKKMEVPSLLIQPYVENAVKHGLLHRRGAKSLLVSLILIENEKMLEVRIDDNGIGREKAGELRSEKHRSFATQASSSRLDLLNAENTHKIGVEIIDKTDESGNATGTLVILRIPVSANVS
jgi:signal transduction histidine kinase/ligand-binding sensor domain-containing protein